MNKLNAIIIEDEVPAARLQRLERLFNPTPEEVSLLFLGWIGLLTVR